MNKLKSLFKLDGPKVSPAGPILFVVSFSLGSWWLSRNIPLPFSDFKEYLDYAYNLIIHHQYGNPESTAARAPLFPLYMAAVAMFAKTIIWFGIWNIVLSSLIPVLTWQLMLRLTGGDQRSSVIAGALSAINPTFIYYSPIIGSEHLFVPLLLLSFIFLLGDRYSSARRSVLSGLFLGLAILTRGEGLFYIPLAVLLIFISGRTVRRKFQLLQYFLTALLLLTVPWAVRNTVRVGPGAGLSTSGGVNFYFAHNETKYGYRDLADTPLGGLDEITASKRGYQLGFDYLRENPSRLFLNIGLGTRKLYSDSGEYAIRSGLFVPKRHSADGVAFRRQYPRFSRGLVNSYYIGLVVLAVSSVIFLKRYSRNARLFWLGIILMNWFCYAVVFWSKARYRFTAEVVLCMLAGITLAGAGRAAVTARAWLRKTRPG